mmetsp:Transcript_31785/g.49194  ORF Transcript_31785/g.49194 Transcript_31785/m.49194 type:complete len:230 (+) Transcript_31785:122-811(+)
MDPLVSIVTRSAVFDGNSSVRNISHAPKGSILGVVCHGIFNAKTGSTKIYHRCSRRLRADSIRIVHEHAPVVSVMMMVVTQAIPGGGVGNGIQTNNPLSVPVRLVQRPTGRFGERVVVGFHRERPGVDPQLAETGADTPSDTRSPRRSERIVGASVLLQGEELSGTVGLDVVAVESHRHCAQTLVGELVLAVVGVSGSIVATTIVVHTKIDGDANIPGTCGGGRPRKPC